MRHLILVLLGLGALLSAAVAAESTSSEPKTPRRDYTLQPGDVIRVQVFQEPDMEREVRVSQEGEISLPLIGSIPVRNRSLAQVEKTVRELYDRDYLVNPQISLVVLKYQPRTVNVLGSVNAPQAVEIPPEQDMNLLDAVSRAGGFNRYGDKKRVRLTRTLADGKVENFQINTEELITGASTQNWQLQPGDVVFVPEIKF